MAVNIAEHLRFVGMYHGTAMRDIGKYIVKTWMLREQPKNCAPAQESHLLLENIKVFSVSESMSGRDVGRAHALGISPLLLHILQIRGFTEEKDIQEYLTPNLRFLANPKLYDGVKDAANLMVKLLLEGKKFVIWGDYDVDGITSTALVLSVLQAHGYTGMTHIPDRYDEGYGLNAENIKDLSEQGVQVIVTVDCGISDYESIAYAKQLGMSVIITDHHLPPQTLPPADAICNPRMGECPCPDLAGVGMAFMLMYVVNNLLQTHSGKEFDMRDVLDLVCLGTLADMVNLRLQNRVLVKNGLLTIAECKRLGLAALKSVCKFEKNAKLTGSQIVFSLAPRINAAGRMGRAKCALDLLMSNDAEQATQLATQLDNFNIQRRSEEEGIHQEARLQAIEQVAQGKSGLVLYAPHWHQGIIGIVASRIVEEFYLPTLILCDGKSHIKGSGRSVNEFHLHDGLSRLSDILLSYGGHKLAAGLSISKDNVHALQEGFNAIVQESLKGEKAQASLTVDAVLDFSAASDAIFLHELELLQPFGVGNAEPCFVSPPLYIKNVRYFGPAKNHVLLQVLDEGTGITLHAKIWRKADEFPLTLATQYIYLVYTPLISTYNNMDSVELRVKDWKIAEKSQKHA